MLLSDFVSAWKTLMAKAKPDPKENPKFQGLVQTLLKTPPAAESAAKVHPRAIRGQSRILLARSEHMQL
jgi:hypothetical protein